MSDINIFSRLFISIVKEHSKRLGIIERHQTKKSALVRNAKLHFAKLNYQLAPIRDLDRVFPSDANHQMDLVNRRSAFLLEPPDRGDAILPVVTIKCDMKCVPFVMRVYMALYFSAPDIHKNDTETLNIMGMRFEAPEGDGGGLHDFFHMQFINGFEKDIPFQRQPIKTLLFPDKQPSIPVDAHCPVTLLIAALLSVYGLNYVSEIVSFEPNAKSYIQRMSCRRGIKQNA